MMVKKMNNFLEKDISYLKLNKKINTILKQNNINIIKDLWITTRKNLKFFGLNDSEIKQIVIKLELNGLDLNKRINKIKLQYNLIFFF